MDRNVGFLVPMAVLSLAAGSFQAWNVWQHRFQKARAVEETGTPSQAEPVRVEPPASPTPASIPPESAAQDVAEPAPSESPIQIKSQAQVLERERANFFRQLEAALARNFGLRGEVEDLKDTVSQLRRRVILMDGMLQARKILAVSAPEAAAPASAAGRLGLAAGLPAAPSAGGPIGAAQAGLTGAPEALEEPGAYRARTWERLAWRCLARGRYRQANQAFYRVLGYTPADSNLHYNLGVLSDRFLNEPARALYHYRIFLQLKPNDPDTPQVRKRIERLLGSVR